MRSERDFLGLPIHSLQAMLREISYCDHNIPCLFQLPIPLHQSIITFMNKLGL